MSTDPRTAPRKSSFSNSQGNCVTVGMTRATAFWRERLGDDLIRVSSSNPNAGGSAVLYTPDEWRAFIQGVKAGEFDLDDQGMLPAKQDDGNSR